MPKDSRTPEVKPSDPRPAWKTACVYGYRLAMLAGLAWLGWHTARSLPVLLNGPQVEATAAAMAQAFDVQPTPDTPESGPPEGSWLLAGISWQMKTVNVPEDAVAPRLVADLDVATLLEAHQNLRGQPDQASMARFAVAMLPLVRRSGKVTVRAWEQPNLKLATFVAVHEGREQVIAGRLATPRSDGTWSLIELIPSAEAASGSESSESLLPLPTGAYRVARRCDRERQPWCDVVLLQGSLSELRQAWEAAGWKIETQFDPSGQGPRQTCRKGNQAVQVWYVPGHQGGPASLVLTRMGPTNAI